MAKTIFITGASRGFGKLWAEALLQRGDKVAATARNIDALQDLVAKYGDAVLPLQLDVTNRAAAIEAVNKAAAHFGSIDVLINNAGYGLFGTVEETTEEQARAQMETNFFGLLWLSQAALPIMRQQKSGHIIQLSSFLGLATIPVLGLYNASKFAVEGLSETLATEVKDFGISITLIEPSGYSTDWSGASAVQTVAMPEYAAVRQQLSDITSGADTWGKPEATTEAILKVIDSATPPLRLLLGKVAYHGVQQTYAERLASFDEWKEVSLKAHGY